MSRRCSHCEQIAPRIDSHLRSCTSAPQRARIGAQLRSKSRTALRKGVAR